MKKLRSTLIAVSFLLLSALFLNGVQAQTKKVPPTVNAGIVNGKALSLPKPEYPEEARKLRITGTVKVLVTIDEKGNVISAKAATESEHPSLKKAAEEAALKAKFTPTILSGIPVKVSGMIVYNFTDGVSNEEKVKVFGVSTFLFMLRNAVANLDKFNQFFESQDFIKESIIEFSEFSAELSPLASLAKLPPDARQAKIDETISAVKGKLNGAGLWQFELGENFGEIMSQLIAMGNGENVDLSKFNEQQVKKNLLRIKELCLSAPAGFPKDVLGRLDEFADFHEKEKIMSEENYEEFFTRMQALISAISPD